MFLAKELCWKTIFAQSSWLNMCKAKYENSIASDTPNLPSLQFLGRQTSLNLHPIFYVSQSMSHVFHDLLTTMEMTLETLSKTFSCQLVILIRSRPNWKEEQQASLNCKDDNVLTQSSFSLQRACHSDEDPVSTWYIFPRFYCTLALVWSQRTKYPLVAGMQ